MKPSNLALQPIPADGPLAEDQPAPGTSAPLESSFVVSLADATPPQLPRRRRGVHAIVIRDQGLAPFRVY